MKYSIHFLCSVLLTVISISSPVLAAEFFVATDGKDTFDGTKAKPFATVQRAQQAVNPGDTVYIRGGKYVLAESQIASIERQWAYVTKLDKSGTKENPIRYWAFENETPIFDLSQIKPANKRIDAFHIFGSWIHIKGIEVVGVQVTIKGHTQSICFANDGSHNIYEMLSMHDGQAIGIYSVKGSDNLFLNCDAYNNHDYTSENGKGGNVDGFGCHPPKGGTGNIFRGCRAWYNSDDGYDCINAAESVTFENCWAMYSGTNAKGDKLGDGNGFKAGGYGSTPVARLPNPIPRHAVRFCLAVGNRASGFYSNHHLSGSDWINNTAVRNGNNFNMLCREPDNKTDIDGIGHTLVNNLSFNSKRDIAKYDAAKCTATNNWFDLKLDITEKDFQGVDEKELIAPRKKNGDLPDVKYMHLAKDSPLNGAGAADGKRNYLGAFGNK